MGRILFINLLLICGIHMSCRGNSTYPTVDDTYRTLLTTKVDPDVRNIQVALLLDTSNSMDGLIDQAKAQLWDIINELSYAECGDHSIKLQIALYEYGNDDLKKNDGYIRQVLSFSEDLDLISKELFALTTNGGSEYCGQAISNAITTLDWKKSNEHLKLVFIAGNEPFTQGPISYKDAALDANEKDITINTIFCGNYAQGIQSKWKDGALLTDGEYTAIDHNQKTVYVATPYDAEIMDLNHRLNNTYVHYGQEGEEKLELQEIQDDNAKAYSPANGVSRAVSKSSKFYTNSSWDLVDAYTTNKEVITTIKKNALPTSLKGKSQKEIKQYILEKGAERKDIQQQIQLLNTKRKDYIKNQKRTDKNNLEDALINAIKKQGKAKSFTWK